MPYLKWDEKIITDFSEQNINALYNQGYVFGRVEKGYVSQTRSLRINLSKFDLSSENRRVLRKTENIKMEMLPLPYANYHWSIGKMGKDFYSEKFGDGTFSANKIKELMTDEGKSNFNTLLVYRTSPLAPLLEERGTNDDGNDDGVVVVPPSPLGRGTEGEGSPVGFTICLETNELLHYCYPFYQLAVGIDSNQSIQLPANLGLGMMLKAIVSAQENGKKYIYLGSFQRPSDTYKLQFEGLEWWDGAEWKTDLEELKNTL